jgi:hypothetical protein
MRPTAFDSPNLLLTVADETGLVQWALNEAPSAHLGLWRLLTFSTEQRRHIALSWGVPDDEAPVGAILHPVEMPVAVWAYNFRSLVDALVEVIEHPDRALEVLDAYRSQMGSRF